VGCTAASVALGTRGPRHPWRRVEPVRSGPAVPTPTASSARPDAKGNKNEKTSPSGGECEAAPPPAVARLASAPGVRERHTNNPMTPY